jgi:hypothetical protein
MYEQSFDALWKTPAKYRVVETRTTSNGSPFGLNAVHP